MNIPLFKFEIGEEVEVDMFAYPELMNKKGTIIYREISNLECFYTITFGSKYYCGVKERLIGKVKQKPKQLSEMSVGELTNTFYEAFKKQYDENNKMFESIKLPTYAFELPYLNKQKRIIPTYIGYKGRTITLVWKDGTKTQAVAKKDEKYDALYGFFIAYYKYIHRDMHSEALQKRLQEKVYQGTEDYQFGYLSSVFQENCGLSGKKITKFFNDYLYIHYPFEDDEDNISRTYKVDEKYL